VLPGLAQCSLDDSEIPTLRQITDDLAKLVDGARQDLDTTLRHLVDHSCQLLLQSHFDEGASREWILHMIDLGQKSHEPS
jgi:hypothetical protein